MEGGGGGGGGVQGVWTPFFITIVKKMKWEILGSRPPPPFFIDIVIYYKTNKDK